ncbi:MAG: hypothetical protein Q8K75_01630 [Chlamydiales bacterium]|nr:hypothetical protein [Chlamydiales bacterium]
MIKKRLVQQETPLTWLIIFYYRSPTFLLRVAPQSRGAINGRQAVARTIWSILPIMPRSDPAYPEKVHYPAHP